MNPVMSTEQLAAELASPGLIVFDASYHLPAEGGDATAEFRAAHIPGARFFDIDEVSDKDSGLPHMVPAAGRFAKLMGAMGVANASRIVFYDQKGLMSAARGWWLMSVFGHDNAFVLDGGLPKWRAEGRPVETGDPRPPAPSVFVPNLHSNRVRGIGDMLRNLIDGAELVLDARSPGRFDATVPEPRAGMRGGHIPGAQNLPYGELLNPDQTLLDPAALRARFAAAGVDGSRPVVTSCGSGVTAAVLTLGLVRAGLPQGAVYDGSWTEWGGRSDTPVEPSGAPA